MQLRANRADRAKALPLLAPGELGLPGGVGAVPNAGKASVALHSLVGNIPKNARRLLDTTAGKYMGGVLRLDMV